MPRKRVIAITESLEELRRLAADNVGTPAADPIRILIVLSRNPTATTNNIAAMTDCTPRQVERALAVYRTHGIAGLLERPSGRGMSPEQLEELRAAMSAGTLETLEEIRAWLEERFGLRYTKRGVGKLIQRELGARREWVFEHSTTAEKPATTVNKMVRFLNALAITGDTLQDVQIIRSALQALFTDVDRVSLYIGIASGDRTADESPYRYLVIIDHEINMDNTNIASQHLNDGGIAPSSRILDHFREQNMPIDHYHPPICHDYYNAQKKYMGSAIFWSRKTGPAISRQSKLLIENLEPFIMFLLTASRTFHEYISSAVDPFHRLLDRFSTHLKLSPQEHRIAWFRLIGRSYQDIADALHISKSTVHKHITSIHQKAGTSNTMEIFAKYFMPYMSIKLPDDDTQHPL